MTKLQQLVVTVVLLLATAGLASAANVSLRQAVAALENPFNATGIGNPPRHSESVTANFFQKSIIASKNRELRGEGEVFIKFASPTNPLMFRFDYFRPTHQEIVSDGSVLWMYLPENKQAIRSELAGSFDTAGFDAKRDRAVNFLQGLGRLSKDFTITFATDSMYDQAGNYVLDLQPNRPMASIRRMFVVVRKDAVLFQVDPKIPFRDEFLFPILATTMYDHQGNSTAMEFSNPRINTMLADILFTFTPPAFVQIVRPPRNEQ